MRWLGRARHDTLKLAPKAASGKTSLDILKERFARGEIDKDEYQERKRILGD